ncbi:hypothetical protein C0J52_18678 [Blattella germanica]|nr:hypothetical protein C0J52_18678 [Blattella germanica]
MLCKGIKYEIKKRRRLLHRTLVSELNKDDWALLWLTRAEREDLKDLDPQTLHTKYLCKEHFTDDMFMNSAKNKLVWNAVPTLFCKPDFAFKDPQNISLASNVDKCDETAAIEVERRGKNDENGACDVDMTEASGTKENSTCITSGNKVESLGHEPGTSGTASLKSSIKVNKYSELRLEKLQSIRGNSEFLLPSSSDIIRKDENISASSSEGKKNTSENDNFMNVESYLNCDAESLCLEHAYRETNERLYPCRYCGEMFLVKSNLILHQTTYHSDQPVGCESCGRVLYKSKSEFMEHVCDHSHTGNQ